MSDTLSDTSKDFTKNTGIKQGFEAFEEKKFYDYSNIQAPRTVKTYQERYAEEKAYKDAPAPGLLDTLWTAGKSSMVIPAIWRWQERAARGRNFEDEEFIIDEEMQADIDLNYNRKESKILSEANSKYDFIARKREIEEDKQRRAVLAKAGAFGTVAYLATGLFDPVVWATGAGTTSILKAASIVKMGTAARIGTAAALNGIENVGLVKAIEDSQSSNLDLFIALGLGSFLGAGISHFKIKGELQRAARADVDNAVINDTVQAVDTVHITQPGADVDIRTIQGKALEYQNNLERLAKGYKSAKARAGISKIIQDLNKKIVARTAIKGTARTEISSGLRKQIQQELDDALKKIDTDTAGTVKSLNSKIVKLEKSLKSTKKNRRFSIKADVLEAKSALTKLRNNIKRAKQSAGSASNVRTKNALQDVKNAQRAVKDTSIDDITSKKNKLVQRQEQSKEAAVKLRAWNRMNEAERYKFVEDIEPSKSLSSKLDEANTDAETALKSTEVDIIEFSGSDYTKIERSGLQSVGAAGTGDQVHQVHLIETQERINKIKEWNKIGSDLPKSLIGNSKPIGGWTKAILSVQTRLLHSKNLSIRGIASRLFESPQGGAQAGESAAVTIYTNNDILHAAQAGKLNDGFSLHLKSLKETGEGINMNEFKKLALEKDRFHKQVMLELQHPGSSSNEGVKLAASGVKKQLKVGAEMMKETGVKYSERIHTDKYVPIVLDDDLIINGISKRGEKKMRALLASAYDPETKINGVRSPKPSQIQDMYDLIADLKIAKAKNGSLTVKTLIRNDVTSVVSVEDVLKQLQDISAEGTKTFNYGIKISSKDAKYLHQFLKESVEASTTSTTPRLRDAYPFDLSVQLDEPFIGSDGYKYLTSGDFVRSDLDFIMESYCKEASANSGYASAGFKSRDELYELLNDIERTTVNRSPKDALAIKEDIEMIVELTKKAYGESLEDITAKTRQGISNAMKLAQARDLVFSGASQIPEAGVVTFKRSWLTLMDSMSWKEFFNPASVRGGKRLGRHVREDFAELDEYLGFVGEDFALFDKKFEVDTLDQLSKTWTGKLVDKSAEGLSRFTHWFSGMKHIQSALDKVGLRSVVGTIKKQAFDPNVIRKISTADQARAGWSNGFLEKELIPWMRQNRKIVKFNNKDIDLMNFAKMPLEMRNKTKIGLQRIAKADIVRGFLGESPRVMNKTAGKIIGQYRNFQILSFEKQLVHGIKHDRAALAGIITGSAFFGYIAWAAKSAYRNIGKEDGYDKFLEEINPKNPRTWFGVLQQIGPLSSLGIIPDVLNSLGAFPESWSGVTGFRTLAPSSVPIVGLGADVLKVPKSLFDSMYDSNKGDKKLLKSLHRVIPMARIIGANQALNALEQE